MKRMKQGMILVLCLLMTAILFGMPASVFAQEKKMVVGAKNFTEQRILGQIMIALLEKNGFETVDKTGLGGTLVARKALENRQIDVYMEYTGTGLVTLLKEDPITDPEECYQTIKELDLKRNDMVWLPPMPFNNTYCLLMKKEKSDELGIQTLSDLAEYVKKNPDEVTFGTNEEFYARPDGYRPLQKLYDFKFDRGNIKKMTPGLLYKALDNGQLDVAMGFATDGRIKAMNLVVLNDDKAFFPVYNPAPVVHKETAEKYPELEKVFEGLSEKLDTESMTTLNYQVDGEHKPVEDVAREWLKSAGLL